MDISAEKKKKFGIIYTPDFIVKYVISGIEALLSEYFKPYIESNTNDTPLNSKNVFFLDPASGMGQFSLGLLEYLRNENLISDNVSLLEKTNQIYCYELLKVHIEKYIESINEFFTNPVNSNPLLNNIYELNTLSDPDSNPLPDLNKNHLLVIMGNPPYSVSTMNKGAVISRLIEDYKAGVVSIGSKPITSLRAIQDDYVKFIRYSQYILNDKVPCNGMIAFVVNHYFLDGIIFSGMRKHLAQEFDYIYILDLNGENKKEIPPELKKNGISVDENLFDIKTGFCIIFLVKHRENHKNYDADNPKHAEIYIKDLYGTNSVKKSFLTDGFNFSSFDRIELDNQYMFKKYLDAFSDEYMKFLDINDIFIESSQGIVTAHDTLVCDIDEERLKMKISNFFNDNLDNYDENGIRFAKIRDWSPENARKQTNLTISLSKIQKWAYRGLDRNFLCYDIPLINSSTHRNAIMQYLLLNKPSNNENNRAICVTRESYSDVWNSVLMTDVLVDNGMISGASGSRTYVYLLKTKNINIHQKAIALFKDSFKKIPNHEEIFYYIYAVLWAPSYRKRFENYLKKEFPRIPLGSYLNEDAFWILVSLGRSLANLHCFITPESSILKMVYHISIKDDSKITNKINQLYNPKSKSVHLNPSFVIHNITQDMWDFEIGGIKQLENWIKCRTFNEKPTKTNKTIPRGLLRSEIEEFLQISYIAAESRELMKKIDVSFEKLIIK